MLVKQRELQEGQGYTLEFKNTGTVRTVTQTVTVDKRDTDRGEVHLEADDGAKYRLPLDDGRLFVGPTQVGHDVRLRPLNED